MKPLIIGLAGFLAGGVLTGVYTGIGGSGVNPIYDQLEAVRTSLSSLGDALTDNRADFVQFDGRLDALEDSIVVLASARETEVPLGPTMAEVLAAVEELRRQVETQFAETRASIADASRGLRRQKMETDWTAIGELLVRWDADEEEALCELRRLSDDALLERYGPPSDVWHRDKGLTWVYTQGHDPETGVFEQRLFLNLVGGYVAGAYVERP